jgi:hypothetical protein
MSIWLVLLIVLIVIAAAGGVLGRGKAGLAGFTPLGLLLVILLILWLTGALSRA